MRMTTGLSLLCLAAFAVTWTSGTAAFEHAEFDRKAAAVLVTDANAYNALDMPACTGLRLVTQECTFTIQNKATTAQYYVLTKEVDASTVVNRFKFGSDAWQTVTATSAEIPAVTGSLTITVEVKACFPCTTHDVFWAVEGKKANVLDSMESRIKLVVTYP